MFHHIENGKKSYFYLSLFVGNVKSFISGLSLALILQLGAEHLRTPPMTSFSDILPPNFGNFSNFQNDKTADFHLFVYICASSASANKKYKQRADSFQRVFQIKLQLLRKFTLNEQFRKNVYVHLLEPVGYANYVR